jgi:hypothetical protein
VFSFVGFVVLGCSVCRACLFGFLLGFFLVLFGLFSWASFWLFLCILLVYLRGQVDFNFFFLKKKALF